MLPLFYIERIKRKLSDKEQQKNIIRLRSMARSLSIPIQNPIIIEDQEVEEQEPFEIFYPDLVKKYGPPVPERTITALKRRAENDTGNHYFFKNSRDFEVRGKDIKSGLFVFAQKYPGDRQWRPLLFYAYKKERSDGGTFDIVGLSSGIKTNLDTFPLYTTFDTAKETIDYGKYHRDNLIHTNRLRAAGAM